MGDEAKPGTSVARWLDEKLVHERQLMLGAAVLAAVLGMAVVWLTFWIWYWVIGFVLNPFLRPTHGMTWWSALGVTALLFVLWATVDRQQLEDYRFETDPQARVRAVLGRRVLGPMGRLAAGPDTARSFVKLLAELLCIGPRMLFAAARAVRRAGTLQSLDRETCGRAMTMLLKADGGVPLEKIAKKCGGDPADLAYTLCLVDGVVPLRQEPVGLTLSESLRQEYADWFERQTP